MVTSEIVRDDACNSCDVHYNLSKVAKILPHISTEYVLDFCLQLCEKLSTQEKHNIWSILQSFVNKYNKSEITGQPDSLAPHKLHIVLQWYHSDVVTSSQRLTFVLKSLAYVSPKPLLLLKDQLALYRDYVHEKEFEPDPTHCPWSGQWPCFSEKSGCVDFISKLPVTVSKLVLSFVGVNNIWAARLVSKRWYIIVKEVLTEHRQFQDHVFRCRALRPATRNVNPTFANKVALCFTPGICTTGHPYVSEEQPEAVKVILEERNVFCNAYHVQNVYKFQDSNRKLHFCRGQYFATGSNDRRVHIRSLESGKLHKTIVGHAGSIQSLLLIEKMKVVISGSYDLTIRAWSIETGAYLRLWRGHRGTITCLDHNDSLLISGARDSMVKVWYLNKSQIKRTFHHPRPILSVKILGDRAAVGTESFHLYLWDVSNGTKLKVFRTTGKVQCVNITPHYVMGGAHNVMYIWNMISLDNAPMFVLPHPSTVLAVQYCYVRCVTGCQDGKIRVWSLVSGDCIKVIRGNAKGDSITALFVDLDRLLINTAGSVISLNFVPTTWDYCSERFIEEKKEKSDSSSMINRTTKRRCKSAVQLRNHIKSTTLNDVDLEDSPELSWAFRPRTGQDSRPLAFTMDREESGRMSYCESVDVCKPQTPDVPPSSPRDQLEVEEEVLDVQDIKTTVVDSATEQQLFKDVFHRGPLSYCGPAPGSRTKIIPGVWYEQEAAKVKTAQQLKKMKSRRPTSAPFVSASLSVHGHLPSFAKRRPQTASIIQHRVNVEPVEKWQSTWQRLLSDIPEVDAPAVAAIKTVAPKIRTLGQTPVRRPKTATARIRY